MSKPSLTLNLTWKALMQHHIQLHKHRAGVLQLPLQHRRPLLDIRQNTRTAFLMTDIIPSTEASNFSQQQLPCRDESGTTNSRCFSEAGDWPSRDQGFAVWLGTVSHFSNKPLVCLTGDAILLPPSGLLQRQYSDMPEDNVGTHCFTATHSRHGKLACFFFSNHACYSFIKWIACRVIESSSD